MVGSRVDAKGPESEPSDASPAVGATGVVEDAGTTGNTDMGGTGATGATGMGGRGATGATGMGAMGATGVTGMGATGATGGACTRAREGEAREAPAA